MLYPVEHCAMTAQAFREDAEFRARPTTSPVELTKATKRKEAEAFERGDHQPDGTVYFGDGNWSDPYDTRKVDREVLHDHGVGLSQPASWRIEAEAAARRKLAMLEAEEQRRAMERQREALRLGRLAGLVELTPSPEMAFYREQQRLKFAQEYINKATMVDALEYGVQISGRLEPSRKAAIRKAVDYFAKNPWPCDAAAKP